MTAFGGALVAQAAAYVCSPRLSDSRTRRLYFVLDEFPQLGKVDIETLVAVGRSKGARVWLGLQDFGQLKKLYGADGAQAITAMVGTLICAGAAPGETAKLISDMAGMREVERSSLSTSVQGGVTAASTSHSWQRETIPVLTQSQVSGLGPVPGTREIRALLLNFGDDALILRWPFDSRPMLANPVELADWTMPTVEKRQRQQQRSELEAMLYLDEEDRCLDCARKAAAHRGERPLSSGSDAEAATSGHHATPLDGDVHRPEIALPEPSPAYIVDAPSPSPGKQMEKPEESEEGPSIEKMMEGVGHATGVVDAVDLGSALLKLAEVADALRQKPGPSREQAPPPRRIR
jgi:hypothetical protein